MNTELLQEARGLLEKAEKTKDPMQKHTFFESAIDIFDEINENHPSDKDLLLITNLRKSFARAQLETIQEMSMKNIETTKFFFNYIFGFPKELHELMNENPRYRDTFKGLAEQFHQDIDFSQ